MEESKGEKTKSATERTENKERLEIKIMEMENFRSVKNITK